MTKIIRFI